jgi:hypothetical protein
MQKAGCFFLLLVVLFGAAACENSGDSALDGDVTDEDPLMDGDEPADGDGFLDGDAEIEAEAEVSETAPSRHLKQIEADLERYRDSTIGLAGRVVDEVGRPISDVLVQVGETETRTDGNGHFQLGDLPRFNRLLMISSDGYDSELLVADLCRPLAEDTVELETIALKNSADDRVRFLFGGDVSFGRRFIDTKDVTPRYLPYMDDPDALILVSDPLPGSRNVVRYVAPHFLQADFPVVNLESVVTTEPLTPHLQKSYVYYSLPASLEALTELGVRYVSLGNNHVYDYLEIGLADTLQHLENAGLGHSGAAATQAEALQPFTVDLSGHMYSMLSMTSVSGSQHTVNYVASSQKGGAADLRDFGQIQALISAEREAGRIPIAQLHTGKEYTLEPTENSHNYMIQAAKSGAALVVCHHPHVAQGVEWVDDVLIVHNLGNLFFDQQRHETFLGLLMQVDMQGEQVASAYGYPIYLEDYRPRPIGGELADLLLRRLAEHSPDHSAFPYRGRLFIPIQGQAVETVETRISLDVTIPDTGFAVADLRGLAPEGASIHSVTSTSAPVQMRVGGDILLYGSFEDDDVDDDFLESARWDIQDGIRMTCVGAPRRGVAALCMLRDADNSQDAVAAFGNRVRVPGDVYDAPNKDLTLFGYARGEDAGSGQVIVRYYASEGVLEFGEQVAFQSDGGSFAWMAFAFDLEMPEDKTDNPNLGRTINPRALRMFLRHSPPKKGEGLLSFDDMALIAWDEDLEIGAPLDTPHARDFLRVEGVPGEVNLELVFQSYQPVK